jgi:hypothetical protein
MTDEEMAVDWICSQGWNESNLPSDEFGQMFQAFLAGLKAGKPKWFKPSEKLPEECSTVLAYDFEDSEPALFRFVASDTWEYLPRRIAWLSNDQIKCWCEIPKYTEEI